MGNPRILLFAALAFITLLIWQAWQEDYGPRQPATQGTAAQDTSPVVAAPGKDTGDEDELPSLSRDSSLTQMQPDDAGGTLPREEAMAGQKPYIRVLTDKLDVLIDLDGGEISQVALRAYPLTLKNPEIPFPLLVKDKKQFYVAQTGILSRNPAPTHLSRYRASKLDYRLQEGEDRLEVPLRWTDESGVSVTKTIVFYRGKHVVDVHHRIENNSDVQWHGSQYRQLVRTRPGGSQSMLLAATFNGAAYYSEDDKFEKINFDDIDEESLSIDVKGGWVGMIQHYFLSAWIPDENEINNFYTRKISKGNRYAIGMISPEIRVSPGQSGDFSSRLYAGPKEQKVLQKLAEGLRLSVDYSWLTVIAQPLFWLMDKINNGYHGESISIGGINNWGWTIIILTLLIKLAFFKLSEYGYRSMANMRRVQPKMMSIKERYGNDKQRMQQAMMELYKKEKINPMSGCFPILLQIPVFIALYWVLLESVELRQAPFMLWIKDLSAADPYFVLPLVMGVTMYVQQKLNPAPMDDTQKLIMRVLPFIFTIFFLFFPSGLVLYWVVNNILSIAQQWVITRRIEAGTKH